MAPMTSDDQIFEEEHFCAHCLSTQDRFAVRCHRCDASFHGAGRYDLISGVPNLDAI